MKTLKQNQTDNHQKEGNKREDKKKTNIRFNSAIFFQLGLVVALVASAWAMNLNIEDRTKKDPYQDRVVIDDPGIIDFIIEPDIVPTKKDIAIVTPQPKKRVITSIVEEVPDDTPIIETKTVAPPTTPVVIAPPVVKPPVAAPPIKKLGPTSINAVEFVPIFPGCESALTNNERIACMNEKISKYVGRKFDTSVANNTTTGSQKIYVQFKIDKNGNVVDINARAADKNLQKEAQRVVGKLPEFTPGKMGDVAVDVIYMLPINFMID